MASDFVRDCIADSADEAERQLGFLLHGYDCEDPELKAYEKEKHADALLITTAIFTAILVLDEIDNHLSNIDSQMP